MPKKGRESWKLAKVWREESGNRCAVRSGVGAGITDVLQVSVARPGAPASNLCVWVS